MTCSWLAEHHKIRLFIVPIPLLFVLILQVVVNLIFGLGYWLGEQFDKTCDLIHDYYRVIVYFYKEAFIKDKKGADN